MNKPPRKILHVDSYSGIGGGQAILNYLLNDLASDFHMDLIRPSLDSDSNHGTGSGVLGYKNSLDLLGQLTRFLKDNSYDILHAHGTRASFWVRIAAMLSWSKVPIVYTLHGFHVGRRMSLLRPVYIWGERILNSKVKKVVCVSFADEELVRRTKVARDDKVITIRNGIDTENFKRVPGDGPVRRELGLGGKPVLFMTASRLHEPKDLETIFNAFRLVTEIREDVYLLVVGDGPDREKLLKLIKKLNLKDKIFMLGWRKDMPNILNDSDVVLLSSRWEGLPLLPIEAGANKKPVIATDIDGVREVVLDRKTGYLFPVGDSNKLAARMIDLAGSSKKREEMGDEALDFIEKNFSKERMIREYKDLYLKL